MAVHFAFVAGFHVLTIQGYRSRHAFGKWELMTLQFFHLGLTPPFLTVMAASAGSAMARLFDEAMTRVSAATAFFAALSVLAFVIMFAMHAIASAFRASTPFFAYYSWWAPWGRWALTLLHGIASWTAFWSQLAQHLTRGAETVLVLLSLGALIWAALGEREVQFHRPLAGCAYVAICGGGVAGHILCVVQVWSGRVPGWVAGIVVVVVAIITFVICNRVAGAWRKALVAEIEGATEAELRVLLQDEARAIVVMRVAIGELVRPAMDFSLFRLLVQEHRDKGHDRVLLATSQVSVCFPDQTPLVTMIPGYLAPRTSQGLFDQFLCSELHRVFVMRQSSLNDGTIAATQIRKSALTAVAAIRNFWNDAVTNELKIGSLIAIERLKRGVELRFRDIVAQYRRSRETMEHAIEFLIEGAGEFRQAYQLSRQAKQVQIGEGGELDLAFQRFVNLYPRFLTQGVVDTGGHAVSDLTAVDDVIDEAVFADIEAPAQRLIKNADARFMLEDASKGMPFPALPAMMAVTYAQIVCVLAFCVGVLIAGPSITGGVNRLLVDQGLAHSCFDNMLRVIFNQGLLLANLSGAFPTPEIFALSNVGPAVYNSFRNYPNSSLQVARCAVQAREDLAEISELQAQGTARHFLERANNDLYSIIAFPSLHRLVMPGRMVLAELFGNAVQDTLPYLEPQSATEQADEDLVLGTMISLLADFELFNSAKEGLGQDGLEMVDADSRLLTGLEFAAPIVLVVVFLPLQLGVLIWFFRRVKQAIRILHQTHQDVVHRSLEPIQVTGTRSNVTNGAQQVPPAVDTMALIPVLVVIVLLIDCAGFFLAFFLASGGLDEIATVLQWSELTSTRRGTLTTLVSMVLAYGTCQRRDTEAHLTVQGWLSGNMSQLFDRFENARKDLLVAASGFDSLLDEVQFVDVCNERTNEFYQLGRCLSLDRSLSEASVLILQTLLRVQGSSNTTTGAGVTIVDANFTDFLELIVLCEDSVFDGLERYRVRLLEALAIQLDRVLSSLQIASAIIISVNALLLLVAYGAFGSATDAIDAMRLMLRLLPPMDVVKHPQLTAFLTGVSPSARMPLVSSTEAVVREINTAFVSVSLACTIDSVNPAFVRLMGLPRGDILGQPLVRAFPRPRDEQRTGEYSVEASRLLRSPGGRTKVRTAASTIPGAVVAESNDTADLYSTLERMRSGEERDPVSLHVRFMNTNVNTLVVPVFDEKGQVESFALLVEDTGRNHGEELAMREMKVRLDGVRERLLPPHLAYSIVCGDGRFVRFQSDAAVLMVLEVTGIDALNISPKFLAHALDRVATCIDEVAKRYRSVHRVRNDGTTITAVAGLFDSDEGLDAWAGQAIDFCSTCITQWRDTRTSPIRDVGLKIGLVCGPAFGGCLGDRPTFILGGPGIRLAEELVTFAQPGEILTEPTVAERLDTSLWRIAPSLIPPSRSSVRTLRVAPVGGLELSPVRGPGRHGLAPLAIPASLFDPPGAHDGPSSERGEGRPDRRNDPQFARRATLTSRLPPPPPRV